VLIIREVRIKLREEEDWVRFPLAIGPIVIVTTVNKRNVPNAAPIACVTPAAAADPPMLIFTCNIKHDTTRNIFETEQFVVNIPGAEIVDRLMITAKSFPYGVNEIEKAGLTAMPSITVKPPRIKECRAHIECALDSHKTYGQEVIFMGQVVSASLDKKLLEASEDEKYGQGWEMFTLGPDKYATLADGKMLPSSPEIKPSKQ